jgi:hypothetical protein
MCRFFGVSSTQAADVSMARTGKENGVFLSCRRAGVQKTPVSYHNAPLNA